MRKAKFQKQLTIAISPEDFELIRQITDAQEISMAKWVRDAVARGIENKSTEGGYKIMNNKEIALSYLGRHGLSVIPLKSPANGFKRIA